MTFLSFIVRQKLHFFLKRNRKFLPVLKEDHNCYSVSEGKPEIQIIKDVYVFLYFLANP